MLKKTEKNLLFKLAKRQTSSFFFSLYLATYSREQLDNKKLEIVDKKKLHQTLFLALFKNI